VREQLLQFNKSLNIYSFLILLEINMPHLAPIFAIVTAVTKAIDIVAPMLEKIFNPDTNKFYNTTGQSIKDMRKEGVNETLNQVNSDLERMDEALGKADKSLADTIDIKVNRVDTAEEALALAERLEELVKKINIAKEEGGELGRLSGTTSEGVANMAKTLRNVAGDMKHVGMTQDKATSGQLQPAPGSVVNQSNSQQTIKIS
jgi:archaellum component FlaC